MALLTYPVGALPQRKPAAAHAAPDRCFPLARLTPPPWQCLASFILVLSLGTLGERQDAIKGAWRSGLLTEMSRALPTNALLGGWNSKSLLGGGAEAVVSVPFPPVSTLSYAAPRR